MTKAIYAAGPLPPPQRAALPRHEALRRLVDQGILSARQADAVQEALHLGPGDLPVAAITPRRLRVPWAEITGYLGGGLLLTGAIVLVATSWTELTELTRTTLVTTFAVLLLIAGIIAAGGVRGLATARQRAQTPRLRVAGALLALAACATAFAVGVALPAGGEGWAATGASGAGLLVAAIGYAVLPTWFGLIGSVLLGVYAVTSGVDAALVASPLNIGLAWFGLGLLTAGLAVNGMLRQRQLGLGLGTVVALFGAQLPLAHPGAAPWAYLLTVALAAGCLMLYRWLRTPVLLVFGVAGITMVVPEAIWDVTNGTVGGAAILLVAGAVLLCASGWGFRLHHRDQPPTAGTTITGTPTTGGSPTTLH